MSDLPRTVFYVGALYLAYKVLQSMNLLSVSGLTNLNNWKPLNAQELQTLKNI